jgi:hypothetical protein
MQKLNLIYIINIYHVITSFSPIICIYHTTVYEPWKITVGYKKVMEFNSNNNNFPQKKTLAELWKMGPF